MHILSWYVWLKSIPFHLLCIFDPLSLNGLSLPHQNAPLWEFLAWRVLVLALGLLDICWACSVYWVTGPAGLCNKKFIYTPGTKVERSYCLKKWDLRRDLKVDETEDCLTLWRRLFPVKGPWKEKCMVLTVGSLKTLSSEEERSWGDSTWTSKSSVRYCQPAGLGITE